MTIATLAKYLQGLLDVGFSKMEMDGIMGGNWYEFYDASFGAVK